MLPPPTRVQYDIAKYLQDAEDRRRILMAFRGIGKTWITVAFVLWRLLRDPQLKVLVVSASKPFADSFTTFSRNLINEVPMLQHLRPKDDQRDSVVMFDIGPSRPAHAPSVKSAGITGQITGSRAGLIVVDDIETATNSLTNHQREKLAEVVKEFDSILSPGGEVVYLGTPHNEDSIYNKLRERGYAVRVWPARVPNEKQVSSYRGALAPIVQAMVDKGAAVGTPTDPKRFNETDLTERELSLTRAGFSLQYMLDTSLTDAERHPLKLRDLIISDVDREIAPYKIVWGSTPELTINDLANPGLSGDRWQRPAYVSKELAPFQGTVMAIDPSGKGADRTAYAVVKALHAQLYATASGGVRDGFSPETLERLALVARENKVNRILVEENFGGGMFSELLRPVLTRIYPCTIEDIRHSKQKELRICDTLEPVMRGHRLIVDRRVIEEDLRSNAEDVTRSLFYQMSRITREKGALKHDDEIDVLSMAVQWFAAQMAAAVDDQIKATTESELDKAVELFLGSVFEDNQTPRKGVWAKRYLD
jgi:hypothetical protein